MNVQESPASATVPAPPIGGLGTGVGSLPHSDPTETARIVLDQLPGLPFVPELPGRGPHAGLVGRGAALLTGIDAELTTTGWRIGTGTSLEHGRAVGTWQATWTRSSPSAARGVMDSRRKRRAS